jgi:Tol biopolymer transport system component
LEKDPDHRLRDIGDVELLLEVVSDPTAANRSWVAWAIAASMLLILAVTIFAVSRKPGPPAPALARFEIPFPEDVTFGPPAFSISPDGRQLAFVAAGSDGVRRVWIRKLDALKAKEIPGSESTRTGFRHVPIWSPDSRYIAFDGGGKLKKVDLFNGLVQTLCDVNGFIAGGSWNREGVIIFGIDSAGHGLMRVSSDGGKPSEVTKGFYPAHEIFPTFLPDGRHFLFMRADTSAEGIYSGSIDLSPQQQPADRVIESDSGAFYVDGHIVFTRNETVLAQRFDTEGMRALGQAMPIAEDVGAAARVGLISVSPDAILYMNYGRNRQFTWFDRQGKIQGIVPRHGELAKWVPNLYVTNLSISPDGKKVVFTRGTRRRESATWVVDLETGVGVQLSFIPGIEEHPIWSPDGTRVAYTNIAAGVGHAYYKSSKGDGKEEPMLPSERRAWIMDWSAGDLALFRGDWTVVRDSRTAEVWVERLRGANSDRVVLRDDEYRFPVISPDQKWIAYVSDESGKDEIYVAPLSTSSQLHGKWKVSSDGGTRVHWRRDGKELFYSTVSGTIMSVDISADSVFASGPPRALFRTETDPAGWDVSPDGQRFLIAIPDQTPINPFIVLLNWRNLLQQ